MNDYSYRPVGEGANADTIDIRSVILSDMLIRGIDPDLKRGIQESARKHGRSLSEEAIALMRKALVPSQATAQKAGDHLKSLIGNVTFTEEELALIESARREPDRELPDLN